MSSDRSASSVFQIRTNFKIRKVRRKGLAQTPVEVILWAVETLGGRSRGVSVQKIRSLVKRHFVVPCGRSDVDKKIDMTLQFAVYFGMLERLRDLYFLRDIACNKRNATAQLRNSKK